VAALPHNSYRKLPGAGAGGFNRYSLWLGADHLLSVGGSLIGERYRRFYFADVEAFVWRRTKALWLRVAFWLACVAGFAALGWFFDSPVRFVWFGLAALFVFAVVWDFLRGPSVACFVKTAVQFERLYSLNREPDLRKLLTQIRPHLTAAQAAAAQSAVG